MDNKIEFFKIDEYQMYKFYQVPKELFTNNLYKEKLSLEAKITYSFLLDRLELSRENNWYNEKGEIYLIYKREELQNKLNLSDKTVTKVFRELVNLNLIFEKRQGLGKPNLIYVGKIKYESIQDIQEQEEVQFQNSKICSSIGVKNSVKELKKVQGINTDNIQTDNINTDIFSITLENIKQKSCLQDFNNEERIFLEDIIDRLYNTINLKIGDTVIPNTKILKKLGLINKNNLIQLLDLRKKAGNVNNISSYMISCLYNNLGNLYTNKNIIDKYEGREYSEEFLESFYDNI